QRRGADTGAKRIDLIDAKGRVSLHVERAIGGLFRRRRVADRLTRGAHAPRKAEERGETHATNGSRQRHRRPCSKAGARPILARNGQQIAPPCRPTGGAQGQNCTATYLITTSALTLNFRKLVYVARPRTISRGLVQTSSMATGSHMAS